ncbi:MAG: BamA/TamA family outer membrane protein [bacterium]|nr:BamA/TamA family outer membrane protein [bacterium]
MYHKENNGRRWRLFRYSLTQFSVVLLWIASANAGLISLGWAATDSSVVLPEIAIETAIRVESGEVVELEGRIISAIRLRGNLKTKDETILRELFLLPGSTLDCEILARDVNFLKGLGLFAEVKVEPRPVEGGVELIYLFVERGDTQWGFAYPTGQLQDGRLQAGMVYRHRSLQGGRESLFVEGSTGYRKFFRINVSRPWFGTIPIAHYLKTQYLDREDVEDFGDFYQVFTRIGFLVSLNRQRPLDHRLFMELSYGHRRFDVDGDKRRERTNTISIGYFRDTRDSFIHPSTGGRFEVQASLADEILGSSIYMLRTHLRWNGYRAFNHGFVGVLAMENGTRWGELFYRGVSSLGGLNSVRSFPSGHFDGWDLNDTANGAVGRHNLILHAELRNSILPAFTIKLPVVGIVDIQTENCLFMDGGFLWNGDTPFVPSGDFIDAFGLGGGIRLYTPFGDVLRLEVGFDNEDNYCFHLGTGLKF